MSTDIQRSQQPATAAHLIESMKGQIARALPTHLTPDRMARVLLTAIRKNPDLANTTRESFAGCIMDLAQIGLEPNTPLGLAYLIPRKNQCTILIGYQGYIELARRSGKVRSIYAHVVRQGDRFEYELGLEKRLVHVPLASSDAPITHAYAVAHLVDADPIFEVLTKSDIERRRKRGASGQNRSTPWDTDYEAMAKKSAIRALWAWLPRSAEMSRAEEIEDDVSRDVAQEERTIVEVKRGLLDEIASESDADATHDETTQQQGEEA